MKKTKEKYIDFDIPLYGGIIRANNFHSSPFRTLEDLDPVNGTEELYSAGEDMLQANFGDDITLDISWGGISPDKGGVFDVSIILDCDWEYPILSSRSYSLSDLKKLVFFLITKFIPTLDITKRTKAKSTENTENIISTEPYNRSIIFNRFSENPGINYGDIANWTTQMFHAKFSNDLELKIGTMEGFDGSRQVEIALLGNYKVYGENETARHFDGNSYVMILMLANTFTLTHIQLLVRFLLNNFPVSEVNLGC